MGAHINIQTHMLGEKRVGQIADQKTIGSKETIQEAIDNGYVVGKCEVVEQNVAGVLKSMANGVAKDGNGRKVDEMLSLQPFATGRLDDVTDDIDKSKIGARLVARTLKELKLDTSNWTCSVEGASTSSLAIYSLTTGKAIGVIEPGKDIDINGKGLNIGTGDTVKWSVPSKGKSGTVAAEKITSNGTRITIAGDALAELQAAEYNGEAIVFTVKIGSATAVKSATLLFEE